MPPALPPQEFLKHYFQSRSEVHLPCWEQPGHSPASTSWFMWQFARISLRSTAQNLTAGLFFQSVSSSYKPSADAFQRHTVQTLAVWCYLRQTDFKTYQVPFCSGSLLKKIHATWDSCDFFSLHEKYFSRQVQIGRFLLLLMFTSVYIFYKFCMCTCCL